MKIVVLDGYTLNPGDLSWAGLKALGECVVHARTPPAEVVPRAEGAAVVLTNKTPLPAPVLGQLPALRYIGVLATGYNIVDVAAAARRGIVVANVPAYGTDSVAQMVFAHLLNLCQRVGQHSQSVHAGQWSRCADFCYWESPLVELAGRTLGIVGFGRIGQAVARIALAFGMKVLASEPLAAGAPPPGVAFVDLAALFRDSDAVTLHCPLTPQTRGLVNAARLAAMKPGAFLINTSRGPLVDARDLAAALREGRVAGAGLDVLDEEPPPPDHPLLGAPNCFVTPHIAWATAAARGRLLDMAVENVKAFLRGERRNVVQA